MCVFCKIVAGTINAHKIYEDKDVLAFLDVNPVSIGHTLVIPKAHYETIFELDSEITSILYNRVVMIAKRLQETLKITDLNILNNNGKLAYQSISHYHIHLIPRYLDDSFKIHFPAINLTNDELLKLKDKITCPYNNQSKNA